MFCSVKIKRMDMFKAFIILLGLSFMLVSCQEVDEMSSSDEVLNVEISNKRLDFQDVSTFFKLTSIEISSTTALRIGDYVEDFMYVDSLLLLVEHFSGKITAINLDGEIEWQLIKSTDDPKLFGSIGIVDFNESEKLVEVYDYRSLSFYRYGMKGDFVDRVRSDIDFSDRALFKDEGSLYDISDFVNRHYVEVGAYRFLALNTKGGVSFFNECKELDPNDVIFSDNNRFNSYGGKVYYQSEFMPYLSLCSIGSVDLKANVYFGYGENSQEVLENKSIKRKGSYIFKEGVPHITQAVIKEGDVYTTYYAGGGPGLFIGSAEQEKVNANYLMFKDVPLGKPGRYWNGYFLSKITVDEKKMFNSDRILGSSFYDEIIENRSIDNTSTAYTLSLLEF